MKLTDALVAGLVVAAAVEGSQAARDLLPDVATTTAATPGTDSATEVRHGQVAAVIAAGAIGSAIGIATGSWRPLLAVLLVAGALVLLHEWLLRKGN